MFSRDSSLRGRWGIILVATGVLFAAQFTATVTRAQEPVPTLTQSPSSLKDDAHHDTGGHEDPVTPLLLGLALILFAAKVGGSLMVRLKQPAVLGELLVGVLMGNLLWISTKFGAQWDFFEILRLQTGGGQAIHGPPIVASTIDMLARIGVVLLLFEVGLESNLADMGKVGVSAFLVATVGVIAPMALGWIVGKWLLPNESWHVHLFLGATLCATSVGITARVFKDLGKTDLRESKIVLGAAVIDDVMGLVVLAVVQAIISKGSASPTEVIVITAKAVGFLVGSVVLGEYLFPHLYRLMARLKGHGMLTVTGLLVCFLLSWVSSQVGLAPIVGAFAAGLILDERHYKALLAHDDDSLEDKIMPLTTVLVPVFFVMMGFAVNLSSFGDRSAMGLAAALTIMAIIGKQVCAFGPIERGLDRLSIGIGMIPRGEVGLIFASIGSQLTSNGHAVVSSTTYTAIVVMVIVTTLITPPLLNWSMNRKRVVPIQPT